MDSLDQDDNEKEKDSVNDNDIVASLDDKLTERSSMMKSKKWLVVIPIIASFFLVGMIGFFVVRVFNGYYGSFMFGPSAWEYQKYLEEKYGKDEGFSYTGKFGENGCSYFDIGSCEKIFYSSKSDKEFVVRYKNNGVFTDQYWIRKNESGLADYYRSLFNEIIPYDYSLIFKGKLNDQDDLNITPEKLLNNKNLVLDIDIMVDRDSILNQSGLKTELELMRKKTMNLFNNNMIHKVKSVRFGVEVGNSYPECMHMGFNSVIGTKCFKDLYIDYYLR